MSELDPEIQPAFDIESFDETELRIFCYGALQLISSLHAKVVSLETEKRELKHDLEMTQLTAEEEKKFDQKTGLLTSAAFKDLVDERMDKLRSDARFNWRRRAANDSTSQYLLFMDLDHFKKLNEVLNHENVDENILLPTVDKLNSAVRGDDDLIGRHSGDEFLVLLMGVDKKSCMGIAERIQSSINEVQIPQTGPYPQLWRYLGVSIGVAEYHYDSNYKDVFNRAHAAHMISKNSPGRNQIIFAEEMLS